MIDIEGNVHRAQDAIARAAAQAGRRAEEITLCAASQMNDAAAVRRAIAAGVTVCGENRVQELTAKQAEGAYDGAEVHLIGHLQKNKARQVAGQVDLIQSVDSLALLQLLEQLGAARGARQRILLEVNIGAEAAKSGFAPAAVDEACALCAQLPHLQLEGMMASPPRADGSEAGNRRSFAQMQQLFVDTGGKKYDNVRMEILSMGMSGDFAAAIACGSTMVRLGTALFGPRDYGAGAAGL